MIELGGLSFWTDGAELYPELCQTPKKGQLRLLRDSEQACEELIQATKTLAGKKVQLKKVCVPSEAPFNAFM